MPKENQKSTSVVRLCAGPSALALRLMFSFDVKREPENHQRFRRAGSTRKGLLAPFRPRRGCRSPKMLAASLRRVAAPSVCFAAARILLAAAPTAPPCIRHWRRSSLLHIFLTSPIYGFAEGVMFQQDFTFSKGVKSAAEQQIGGERKCG